MIWKFGLIGKSLGHSFSPTYFSKKFDALNLRHTYQSIELDHLTNIRNVAEDYALNGFNVTIPYKEEMVSYMDELTPEAKAIGAVNCVVIKNNKWIGHNTDIKGFEKSILPFLENHYPRALIIGTGGASKAVAYVLQLKGIEVFYLSRNPKKNNELGYSNVDASSMIHFPLIINCTPLGTWPNTQTLPSIPYNGLTNKHYLFDMVYNPEITSFMKKGLAQGCQVQNGRRMLEIQADLSWDFWEKSLNTGNY